MKFEEYEDATAHARRIAISENRPISVKRVDNGWFVEDGEINDLNINSFKQENKRASPSRVYPKRLNRNPVNNVAYARYKENNINLKNNSTIRSTGNTQGLAECPKCYSISLGAISCSKCDLSSEYLLNNYGNEEDKNVYNSIPNKRIKNAKLVIQKKQSITFTKVE